jgi:hypothetical protein
MVFRARPLAPASLTAEAQKTRRRRLLCCRFAEPGASLGLDGDSSNAMKFRIASRWHSAIVPAATMLLASVTWTSAFPRAARAQDSGGGESWQEVDRVLVVPQIYQPDAATAADGCAEDCPDSSNQASPAEPPTVVSGTADEPAPAGAGTAEAPEETVAADGTEGAEAAVQDPPAPEPSQVQAADAIGSLPDYQQQQEIADQVATGTIVQVPEPIVVPVPLAGYVVRGFAPPVSAAVRPSLPNPTTWMPPPIARPMPLPSIVSSRLPQASVSMPGSSSAGFRGGFGAIGGFRGGFGHR